MNLARSFMLGALTAAAINAPFVVGAWDLAHLAVLALYFTLVVHQLVFDVPPLLDPRHLVGAIWYVTLCAAIDAIGPHVGA